MYINDTEYHVNLVTAISIILFILICVCGIRFWNFYFGEKVLVYGTH